MASRREPRSPNDNVMDEEILQTSVIDAEPPTQKRCVSHFVSKGNSLNVDQFFYLCRCSDEETTCHTDILLKL